MNYISYLTRKRTLRNLILDSYERMSTNRDENYRNDQKEKLEEYLEEMTKLNEKYPDFLMESVLEKK